MLPCNRLMLYFTYLCYHNTNNYACKYRQFRLFKIIKYMFWLYRLCEDNMLCFEPFIGFMSVEQDLKSQFVSYLFI